MTVATSFGVDRRKDGGAWSRIVTQAAGSAAMRMGLNAGTNRDFAAQLIWSDAWHGAREWDKLTTPGGSTTFDAAGFPTNIDPAHVPSSFIYRDIGGRYRAGTYVLLWDGNGTLEVRNDSDAENVQVISANRLEFDIVTPTNAGIIIKCTATDPAPNNVTNIRLITPGNEATYVAEPFIDEFVDSYAKFAFLRMMDMSRTNDSPQVDWADRAEESDCFWTTDAGVPWEKIFEMANLLAKDCWICVPHQATDAYVTSLATLALAELDPGIGIYLEYSNETWNFGFDQAAYCKTQAESEPAITTSDPFKAGYQWYSLRSQEIFDLWDAVWTGDDDARVTHVLAGQAGSGSAWQSTQIMEWDQAATKADVLAIAPYFGGYLGTAAWESTVEAYTLSQLFAEIDANAVDEAVANVAAHKTLADTHSVRLIAYEGGQHLAAVGSVSSNQTIIDLFRDANRDERMKATYTTYLDAIADAGIEDFAVFSTVSAAQNSGSWGLWEYSGQPLEDAPKADAVLSWIDEEARDEYLDDSAKDPGTYDYRVVGIAGGLESDPSATATVVIPATIVGGLGGSGFGWW